MSWVAYRDKYQALAREIDPAIRITTKDAWPWKVLAALAMVFTFGGIKYRAFLTQYATTIGPIQGYPREWSGLSSRVIIHEAQHTKQSRMCGLWIHPWVGLPIFALLYLLLPLPLGLAWFRWRFEISAELAANRWALRNGYGPAWVRERAASFGARVCGGNYGWSWIIGGRRGFQAMAERAIREAAGER